MIYIIANCVQRRTRTGIQVSYGADEVHGDSGAHRSVEQWAMQGLMSQYPESDGWFGHAVRVHELDREVLRREIGGR
jgi:hypothetical protein